MTRLQDLMQQRNETIELYIDALVLFGEDSPYADTLLANINKLAAEINALPLDA